MARNLLVERACQPEINQEYLENYEEETKNRGEMIIKFAKEQQEIFEKSGAEEEGEERRRERQDSSDEDEKEQKKQISRKDSGDYNLSMDDVLFEDSEA
jgi:hypothetical protein